MKIFSMLLPIIVSLISYGSMTHASDFVIEGADNLEQALNFMETIPNNSIINSTYPAVALFADYDGRKTYLISSCGELIEFGPSRMKLLLGKSLVRLSFKESGTFFSGRTYDVTAYHGPNYEEGTKVYCAIFKDQQDAFMKFATH